MMHFRFGNSSPGIVLSCYPYEAFGIRKLWEFQCGMSVQQIELEINDGIDLFII